MKQFKRCPNEACPNCQAIRKFELDDLFCSKCGTALVLDDTDPNKKERIIKPALEKGARIVKKNGQVVVVKLKEAGEDVVHVIDNDALKKEQRN